MRVAFAPADLDKIWLHFAMDSLIAADRLVDNILKRCEQLATLPELGPARPEIAKDARMLTLDDYVVLYRLAETAVEIVRIAHGARHLAGLFGGDGAV